MLSLKISFCFLKLNIKFSKRSILRPFSSKKQIQNERKKDADSTLSISESDSFSNWEYGTFCYGKHTKMDKSPHQVEDFLWNELDDNHVNECINVLKTFCNDQRVTKLESVLDNRTEYVRMVYENPANPNNVWAALRTLDSFGVQNVDIVMEQFHYQKGWRRATMVSAMGAQKWLSLQQHYNTGDMIKQLRDDGYRIIATDLGPRSKPISEIDWKSSPCAIVMGNELTGISDEVRAAADETFYIPMKGFAESLNVSVAAAVLLSALDNQNVLKPGINEKDKSRILLTWLARSVPGSLAVLRREGYSITGNSLYPPIGKFTTKP